MSLLAVHSLSPLQALDQMGKETKLTVIAGMNDSMRSNEIAHIYVARATALGISASMVLIPSRGRDILNAPLLIKYIANVIREN